MPITIDKSSAWGYTQGDMPQSVEIPKLKLAKVGKRRERKKGGAAWLGGGAGGPGFSGAVGGGAAGAAGGMFGGSGSAIVDLLEVIMGRGLATVFCKALVVALVAGLGVGAVSVGRALKAIAERPAAKAAVFIPKTAPVDPKYDGGMGDLLNSGKGNSLRLASRGQAEGAQGSVGMVSGTPDGKTQGERDAEAAASAAAARAAEAEAAAKRAEASAKLAEASQKSSAEGSGQEGLKGAPHLNAGAFGAFGASLGKGSQGGSPYGYSSPQNIFDSGKAGAAGSGPSAKGSSGRLGKIAPLSARASSGRVKSPLAHANDPGRGLARSQLGRASQLSGAAINSPVPETMSQNGQNAFQSPMGGGSAITGGGAGTTGGGASSSSSNPGGGGGVGGGTSPGGGGGGSSGAGQSNPTLGAGGGTVGQPTRFDTCDAIFPDGGYINGGSGGCVCPPGQDNKGSGKCGAVKSSNAAPWQALSDMAKMLLLIATVLLTLATIMGMTKLPALYAVAKYMCYIAAVLAGIVTMLGISMIAMGGGGEKQGLIYTISGGILTVLALIAADHYNDLENPTNLDKYSANPKDVGGEGPPGGGRGAAPGTKDPFDMGECSPSETSPASSVPDGGGQGQFTGSTSPASSGPTSDVPYRVGDYNSDVYSNSQGVWDHAPGGPGIQQLPPVEPPANGWGASGPIGNPVSPNLVDTPAAPGNLPGVLKGTPGSIIGSTGTAIVI